MAPPRTFRIEHDSGIDEDIFPRAVPLSRSREQLANQELIQVNQKLQNRVQKLSVAYQSVEQQNVTLKERCVRLQNRVDELKNHLASIKADVGGRVPPMRLIAGHLFELASFLEALDDSIETGGEGGRIPVESILAGGRVNLTEKHSILNRSKSLDTINESIEVPESRL